MVHKRDFARIEPANVSDLIFGRPFESLSSHWHNQAAARIPRHGIGIEPRRRVPGLMGVEAIDPAEDILMCSVLYEPIAGAVDQSGRKAVLFLDHIVRIGQKLGDAAPPEPR